MNKVSGHSIHAKKTTEDWLFIAAITFFYLLIAAMTFFSAFCAFHYLSLSSL